MIPSSAVEAARQFGRQPVAEHLQAAVQKAAERAVTETELLADGVVIRAGQVAERERHPVLFGQRTQSREHALPGLFLMGGLVRRWAGIRTGRSNPIHRVTTNP